MGGITHCRFLKAPVTKLEAKGPKSAVWTITAVVTLTTDLGETFYEENATLEAVLYRHGPGNAETAILSKTVDWTFPMRALKVVLQVDATNCNPKQQYALKVGEKERKGARDALGQYMMARGQTSVLPIWSLPFKLGQKTKELFVERRLRIREDRVLKVVEETGESIARHIWDAGLSASLVLASLDNEKSNLTSPELRKAIKGCLGHDHVNILELGAGCGTFGITFATLFENCQVTLTDLGLAEEIADLNLKANSHGDRAKFVELDWTEPLPEHYKTSFGLVIMTDCTYNSAYFEPLVGVIDTVLHSNNRLLMAYKQRHEDEKQFFELMEAKGLEVTCRTKVAIGGDTENAQLIELLIYQRK
ncbi:hypothetical protein YB2330_003815 [Saitoella coloradoensis]